MGIDEEEEGESDTSSDSSSDEEHAPLYTPAATDSKEQPYYDSKTNDEGSPTHAESIRDAEEVNRPRRSSSIEAPDNTPYDEMTVCEQMLHNKQESMKDMRKFSSARVSRGSITTLSNRGSTSSSEPLRRSNRIAIKSATPSTTSDEYVPTDESKRSKSKALRGGGTRSRTAEPKSKVLK